MFNVANGDLFDFKDLLVDLMVQMKFQVSSTSLEQFNIHL